MSIVNSSNFNMPSLNGLVDINSDSINSTNISSDSINSKNVDTETLYVNGIDLGTQVNSNAQKLTAITYIDTPSPITKVSSYLDVSGNTTLKILSVSGSSTFNSPIIANSTVVAKSSLDVSGSAIMRSALDVLGRLHVFTYSQFDSDLAILGVLVASDDALFESSIEILKSLRVYETVRIDGVATFNSNIIANGNINVSGSSTFTGVSSFTGVSTFNNDIVVNGTSTFNNNVNITGNIDTNGTMTLRNSTNSMSIYYDDAYSGWRFINNNPNGYMYFSTQDTFGNIRNFQFNASQLYTNLLFFIENWLGLSFNNRIVLGDANSAGVYLGGSINISLIVMLHLV